MRSSLAVLIGLMIQALVGCRGPLSVGYAKPTALATPHIHQQDSTASTTSTTAEKSLSAKTQAEALAEVLDALTEVGALDPDAKRQLMSDLAEAKPENWPPIVRQFRSALAYREQLAARERLAANESLAPEKPTALLVDKPTTRPIAVRPNNSIAAALPVSSNFKQLEPLAISELAKTMPRDAPQAEAVTPKPPLVLTKPPQPVVAQQVNYPTAVGSPHGWKAHLHSAVQELQSSVQPAPGSTDEVNEHLRLRLLQLLAGEQDAAFGTIPGATAPQQDYWNQQLFAVSTFLDSAQQPDNKRRAAGTLMHLDQARANLAELATLQVRKLTFVDSVEGYGAYEVREDTKFRPGDQVTLYAEIENFSSESTKEGHSTRFGTSYEVVDKSGKRVDSAQFPEVEDLCRNPRRDFHMQYTVTLPMHIYPEQYEIRLIVTDQKSHKIGQASLPFEISE